MKINRTNRLDEMQDQKLLKLEEAGFWILFWVLSLSILVQLLTGGSGWASPHSCRPAMCAS